MRSLTSRSVWTVNNRRPSEDRATAGKIQPGSFSSRRISATWRVAKLKKRTLWRVWFSLAEAEKVPGRTEDLIALEEALVQLAKIDERKSRLIELRYFGGLTSDEAAEVLGISPRTADREWELARVWLFRVLSG